MAQKGEKVVGTMYKMNNLFVCLFELGFCIYNEYFILVTMSYVRTALWLGTIVTYVCGMQ